MKEIRSFYLLWISLLLKPMVFVGGGGMGAAIVADKM
jgi:hypothetical protein